MSTPSSSPMIAGDVSTLTTTTPPAPTSSPAADYRRAQMAAEDSAHRNYMAALPVSAWPGHFADRIRITAGAAASMLRGGLAELRAFTADATAQGEHDVAANLLETLEVAGDTVAVAVFGPPPRFPTGDPGLEERTAYQQQKLTYYRGFLTRAQEKFNAHLLNMTYLAAEAAEQGKAAEATHWAELALSAAVTGSESAPDGAATCTAEAWREAYARARLEAGALRQVEADQDSEQDTDADPVADVTTDLAEAAAKALARGDRAHASELMALLLDEAAPRPEVEEPSATPVVEVDVRPAPAVPRPTRPELTSESAGRPAPHATPAGLPSVEYTVHRATAFAEISAGNGAEVSIGRSAGEDGAGTLLLDLEARGLRFVGSPYGGHGACFELDDISSVRSLAAALLGALAEADRVGIVAPTEALAGSAPAP